MRLKVIFPPLKISFGTSPTTKPTPSYFKTLRIASADRAHIFNNKMKIRRLLFLRPNRSKHLGPSQQPNPYLEGASKAYYLAPENMFWSLSNRQTQPWFSQKMTPGVGLVVGEVPKLIFRGRKITLGAHSYCILATAMLFFEK